MVEKAKNDHAADGQEVELAGLVERLAANIIDNLVLVIPILAVQWFLLSSERPVPLQLLNFILLAVPVAYHWYFWTRRDGQTPGKFALGIRVIKSDGGQLGDVDAVIRAIGYHVSAMVFGLGYIWTLFDKKNQTWHDKMARTYVIRAADQRKTITIDG